jgi:plasmid stability protein
MAASPENERRVRLSIDVSPDLKRRLKIAAARQDVSIRDYVEALLRQALEADEPGGEAEQPSSTYYPPVAAPRLEPRPGRDLRYWET